MVQLGNRASLALETFIQRFVRDLEGDKAMQACVQRTVDLSHTARAKNRLDSVGAKLGAGCGLSLRAGRHRPPSSAEDKQNPGRAQLTARSTHSGVRRDYQLPFLMSCRR